MTVQESLAAQGAQKVFVLTVKAINLATQLEETFFFSNTGFRTRPNDTPANQFYRPRLRKPLVFERTIFAPARLGGRQQTDSGFIEINNADGELDFLQNYDFGGRAITQLVGDENSLLLSEFQLLLEGQVQVAEFTRTSLRLRVKGNSFNFDVPFQEVTYLGDNVGSTGIEGTALDIKGRPKVKSYGEFKNRRLVLLNEATLIYAFNTGESEAVDKISDNGIELDKDTSVGTSGDFATLNGLKNATIAPGEYITSLVLGLVRLESAPAGEVTIDGKGDKAGGVYVNTVADIIERVATDQAGFTDFDTAAFTALNSAKPDIVGLYITDPTEVNKIFNELITAVGGFWHTKRDKTLTVGVFEIPSGVPVDTFTDNRIKAIAKITPPDKNKDIPIFKCIVKYQEIFTQQRDGLAGAVTEAERAFLENKFRNTEAVDLAVKAIFLKADELIIETPLQFAVDAQALADETLLILKEKITTIQVRVTSKAFALDINEVVRILHPRFGLSLGLDFRIIRLQENVATNTVIMDLWRN